MTALNPRPALSHHAQRELHEIDMRSLIQPPPSLRARIIARIHARRTGNN